jgi:hypothetical protein
MAQNHVVPAPWRPESLPEDEGVHNLRRFAASQVDEAVAEAAPRPLELGGEVPSVRGAVEEDVGGALSLVAVNHPLGVRQLTGPSPAKGDARSVLIRVEVPLVARFCSRRCIPSGKDSMADCGRVRRSWFLGGALRPGNKLAK